MLRALRNKKTAKKVWIVLAVIIVPAFVLWGSGSLLRSKEERWVRLLREEGHEVIFVNSE